MPLFTLLQWVWVHWTRNRQKFPIHETHICSRRMLELGWMAVVCMIVHCVCLLNKWSIEREHGQLIIYHKFETKHLFKCTNKCAANRKVFNVQTRNSVECDFWHLCQRRYGNVYSIGKRMSKWIMPVWHMHSYQSSIRFAMIRIHRRLSLINMKWEIERHTRREEGEEAE